jgi:hypothetical protein
MADEKALAVSGSLAQAIATLQSGTLIEGRWFKNVRVPLVATDSDGYHFHRNHRRPHALRWCGG